MGVASGVFKLTNIALQINMGNLDRWTSKTFKNSPKIIINLKSTNTKKSLKRRDDIRNPVIKIRSDRYQRTIKKKTDRNIMAKA